MGRPRNTSIKLVLDVPESVYMELAILARGDGCEAVSDYVENVLALQVAKSISLPPLEPSAQVVPVEPIGSPADAVPVAEVGGFGPGLDMDKHGKKKRKG